MSATLSNTYVLDAFAVLALINDEPGALRVKALFEAAEDGDVEVVISLINLGEALYRVARSQGEVMAGTALSALDALPLIYLDVTRERVLAAARLKATHRISYADAFAASAAQELGATVVTGDPEFRSLEEKILIEWLPQPNR